MGGNDEPGGTRGQDERAARLAAALRANLKRRKAQAREAAAPDGDTDVSTGEAATGVD